MSQQINIQDSVSLVPSGYTGLTSLTTTTSYPVSNGYTDSSSTTYARFTLSSGSTGYLYYTFTAPDIPSSATIDSVTCSVRARVSSTSRITNTVCQLYTGTTAKGSSSTFASTSSTNTFSLTTGTWTISELQDIRLRVGGTGSSSGGGGSSRYIYFYGASLTINYSITGTQYTLTASSEVNDVTILPLTSDKLSGESETFTIELGDVALEDIIVKDNDTDVTSSLVQHEYESGDTIAATASSVTTELSASGANFYTSSSSTGNYFSYAVGATAASPGYTSASATYVKDNSSNTATGWAIYSFDFSSIPENATIDSVSVSCYGFCESTTHDSTHKANITLRNGSTVKSTEQYFTSTSNNTITITDPGTWTRAELQNAKLYFEVAYYGGGIFGITWNVTYSVDIDGYYYTYTISNVAADHTIVIGSSSNISSVYLKINNSWTIATKVYKKINGSWVEQNDLTQVFDNNVNYIKR